MSIQTLIEHGPFIGGTAEPLSGEHGRSRTRALASSSGASRRRPRTPTAPCRPRRTRIASWARLGYADRGKIIHACAEAFEAHVDELTPILVAEQGKTIREAKIELRKAADTLEHYAGLSRQVRGISVHNVDPGVEARTLRRPLGVVAAIVPWNFPTTLLCNKLGPAFLAGNTVVAKPADTTPFTTLRLAEIFHEAGLPAGVLNVAPGRRRGRGRGAGQAPAVRKVAFTGSTPVGERVHALAAEGSKRVTLELGGSDPMIICDDADLEGRERRRHGPLLQLRPGVPGDQAAVRLRVRGGRGHRGGRGQGQAAARGDRSDRDSQLGPMHTERQRAIMERQIAESGGEILAGGGRPEGLDGGWFHEPTVVLEPGRDSPMAVEEVFGPALPIWRVKDLDEAIELANASPFGLGSSLWTRSLDTRRARRRRARLRLHVDQLATKVYDELPFGGLKASGYGKEHGSEALDYYTDTKSVVVKRAL